MKPLRAVILGGMVMGLLVTGCGSSKHSTTAGTAASTIPGSTVAVGSSTSAPATPTVASTSPSSAAPPTSTPTSASTSSSSPRPVSTTTAAALRLCATSQLAASLGSGNGTAGTDYYGLNLRNVSSAACFVQGYPGVSFVAGADGHRVGNPAERVAGSAPRVVLTPQRSAVATLAVVDAGNYGTACQLTPVLGFRVYPPDQTAALYVAHADQACANTRYTTLRIGPLQP